MIVLYVGCNAVNGTPVSCSDEQLQGMYVCMYVCTVVYVLNSRDRCMGSEKVCLEKQPF